MPPSAATSSGASKSAAVLRVTAGNFLEQFDFFLFGFYATQIAAVFFPAASEFASLMMTFAAFGAGWLAGVVGTLGQTFNIAALRTVGQVGRFVLPTDGLWHAAIYYLQPPSLIAQRLAEGSQQNPFFAQGAPSWAYLLWIACWFLIVLGAAVASFERREL